MSVGTAFHPRTEPLCAAMKWKEWSGHHAVARYDDCLEWEYSAFRNRAGLLDVSPLFKTRVRGPQARALLDRMVTRDLGRCRPNQVVYTPWCDERGKVVDDGTIQCWGEEDFRLTSAYPASRWLEQLAPGLDVDIQDESAEVAALALQGPTSREVLRAAGVEDIDSLRFFRSRQARLAGATVDITRTGYTGDLGYELWTSREHALELWDRLMQVGAAHGITPTGLDALDLVRLEAGLILIDVDYYSSRRTMTESRLSSPFECGLGWCVPQAKKTDYLGRAALQEERQRGSAWALVGVELDWPQVEAMLLAERLTPEVPPGTSRDPVPLYRPGGAQIGYATSHGWSPILKKSIALATVDAEAAATGTHLEMEVTVQFRRRRARAIVVDRPFFDPPRKRA